MSFLVKLLAAILLAIAEVQSSRVSFEGTHLDEISKDISNETTSDDALGKNLFDLFFQGKVEGSAPVVNGESIHVGSFGSGKRLSGVETTIDFASGQKRTSIDFGGPAAEKKVRAYSYNKGKGLVLQWSGESIRDLPHWQAFVGGMRRKGAQKPVMKPVYIYSNPSGKYERANMNIWAGRVKKALGESQEDLRSTMCGEKGTDGKTVHKYAMELVYAQDREDADEGTWTYVQNTEDYDTKDNMWEQGIIASENKWGLFAKMESRFTRGLLVLQYKCTCLFSTCRMNQMGVDGANVLAEISVQKLAIYLSAE